MDVGGDEGDVGDVGEDICAGFGFGFRTKR